MIDAEALAKYYWRNHWKMWKPDKQARIIKAFEKALAVAQSTEPKSESERDYYELTEHGPEAR